MNMNIKSRQKKVVKIETLAV